MPEDKNAKNNRNPAGAENVGLRVSLMPDEIRAVDPAARFRTFVKIVAIGMAVVLVGTGSLWGEVYFKRAEARAAEENLAETKNALAGLDAPYGATKKEQDKINDVAALWNAHIRSSRVFNFLEKDTLPKVSFDNLNFTSSGALAIAGIAADYETLVAQVETIESDPIAKSVSFSGVNGDFDEKNVLKGVHFNLNVVLDPSFLKNSAK